MLAVSSPSHHPLQVLLRGAPDWDSCIAVVNAVVNASAPCAVHEHLPACVLGTPQPELQGNFMALTGVLCCAVLLCSSSLTDLVCALTVEHKQEPVFPLITRKHPTSTPAVSAAAVLPVGRLLRGVALPGCPGPAHT
jgi:hypothetical protein